VTTTSESDSESDGSDGGGPPRLKYVRLGGNVVDSMWGRGRLSKNQAGGVSRRKQLPWARAMDAGEKLLALAEDSGAVHVMDLCGEAMRRFDVLSMPPNCVHIEPQGEFVATCSNEGRVVVQELCACPFFHPLPVRQSRVGSTVMYVNWWADCGACRWGGSGGARLRRVDLLRAAQPQLCARPHARHWKRRRQGERVPPPPPPAPGGGGPRGGAAPPPPPAPP
jgi:hypothetical protein